MNTHDLRYIKTEKTLKEAFLRLKSTGKPFTLTQLCEEALINKTTFYKHYETLDDFEHKVCKEELRSIYLQCEHIYDAFTDTRYFVSDLRSKIKEHAKTIQVLFQNRIDQHLRISEELLLELYLDKVTSKEDELKIRFAIAGSSKILVTTNDEFVNDYVITLLEKVMSA